MTRLRLGTLLFTIFFSIAISSLVLATPRVTRTPAQSLLYHSAIQNVVRIELWEKGRIAKFGTGFFADDQGTIITNAHVVEEALEKPYRVRVRLSDGRASENIFVGACGDSATVDLCAIKVAGLRPATRLSIVASNEVSESGTLAFSFGHPQAVSWAMSRGLVGEPIKLASNTTEFIRITTPIAPGSSGGPVLNIHGEVMGVVTSQVSFEHSPNVGVAISHRELKTFLLRKMDFRLLEVVRALKEKTPDVLHQERLITRGKPS